MIGYLGRRAIRSGMAARQSPQRRPVSRPARKTARQRRSEARAVQVATVMCVLVLAALIIVVAAS